jgi:CheY-like chemotaxis protein
MKLKPVIVVSAKLIASGLLISATFQKHQYDYYTLMRWAVCAVSIFAAFTTREYGKKGWIATLVIAALVFNPLFPVHFTRQTWAAVDLVAAGVLLASIAFVDLRSFLRRRDRTASGGTGLIEEKPAKICPLRFVLLDDEPLTLDVTGETLQRHFKQATILKFTDSQLALLELLRTPPDLFTTDINHPSLSCEELLRRLVANQAHFPIFVISGHEESRQRLASITQALDLDITLIAKPWRGAELIRQVAIHVNINKSPITALFKFFKRTYHFPIAKYKEQAKTIAWGLLAVAAAIWFWLSCFGNPIRELAFIQEGRVVIGSIVETWEVTDDDNGDVQSTNAAYVFRLPDGRELKAVTTNSSQLKDDLHEPYPIEVEYLASNPEASRIKGDGCQSVFEWLWRKVGLGGLMLALFLSPGCCLLRNAIRDIKRVHKGLLPLSRE